jgi:hypothetical protein
VSTEDEANFINPDMVAHFVSVEHVILDDAK